MSGSKPKYLTTDRDLIHACPQASPQAREFGQHNLRYIPLLVTHEPERAEQIILDHMDEFRIYSRANRPMEWLEGISIRDVIAGVFSSLDDRGFVYKRLYCPNSDI